MQGLGIRGGPLRPQTLILPRSLAGWAQHHYILTLHGKDALNFLRALGEKLTPAE